jgi:Bacteriophage baseplate protein W
MVRESGNHLAFPFHISSNGSMNQVSAVEEHVKHELIQLVLTDIGERLFLPEFGGGARGLLFKNIDEATSSIVKSTLVESISKWLGHRITIVDLKVTAEEERLNIEISYRLVGTEDIRTLLFQHVGR